MNFNQAYLKMKTGDAFDLQDLDGAIIKCEDGYFYFSDVLDNPISFNEETAMLEGEVIRSEPKVLTVDECFRKLHPDNMHPQDWNFFLEGFDEGKPIGRLEMYQEFQNYFKIISTTIK